MDLVAISNLPWDTGFAPGAPGPPAGGARTHLASEAEIDRRLAGPGPVETEGAGGSPTNAALSFAALGGTVTVIGPVAGDVWGRRVREEMRRHGARLLAVAPPPVRQAHSLGYRGAGGERIFLATLPHLEPGSHHPPLDWSGPGWLVSSAYELSDPHLCGMVLEAFTAARAGGRGTAFDLADPHFVRRHRAAVARVLEIGVDVLLTGEDALASLAEGAAGGPEPAERAGTVLVTRGARGVRLHHAGEDALLSAPPREARDTTGAGDALLGAFLWARARGAGADRATRFGLAVAGEVVACLGARLPAERWDALRREWEDSRVGPGG